MKLSNILISIATTLIISYSNYAQMAVVSYMKVAQGNTEKYLEIEKKWKKIHKARIDAGVLEGWEFSQIMFAGTNSPYHYVTVNFYKDMAQFESSADGIIEKALPGEDIDKLFAETEASRVLTHNEVFNMVTELTSEKEGKYTLVNYFSVAPNNASLYEEMEKTIYQPMHQEHINTGNRTYWGIWSMWPRSHNKYQYVAVDSFTSLGDDGVSFEDLFKKVHAGKDINVETVKTNNLRTLAKSEIQRTIDSVWKEQ